MSLFKDWQHCSDFVCWGKSITFYNVNFCLYKYKFKKVRQTCFLFSNGVEICLTQRNHIFTEQKEEGFRFLGDNCLLCACIKWLLIRGRPLRFQCVSKRAEFLVYRVETLMWLKNEIQPYIYRFSIPCLAMSGIFGLNCQTLLNGHTTHCMPIPL